MKNITFNLNRRRRRVAPVRCHVRLQKRYMEHRMIPRHALREVKPICKLLTRCAHLLDNLEGANPARQELPRTIRSFLMLIVLVLTSPHRYGIRALNTSLVGIILLPLLCTLKCILRNLQGIMHTTNPWLHSRRLAIPLLELTEWRSERRAWMLANS